VLELIATDAHGASGRTSLPITVGNTPPQVRFQSPQDGDFFVPGNPLTYTVAVQDAEDGRSETDDELMDARVFVNARWSRGDGKESTDEPGLALMKQSDCFNCHAVETRIVGPPLLEVANKYRGQAGALEASVQRVQKGSSKVWGEVPMLPHESLTGDQIQLMVRWIYALEPGKAGAGLVRGLQGRLEAPKDDQLRTLILEASYTDAGRAPANPLAAQTTIRLRHPRLEAERADEILGPKVQGNNVGSIDHGHSLRFTSVNLTECTNATVRVASGGIGGTLEVRAGSPTGDLLASFEVQPTGGWGTWVELSSPLRPTSSRGDVAIVFRNPGKGGLMNLDWIQFAPR
jgi:cytochrome c